MARRKGDSDSKLYGLVQLGLDWGIKLSGVFFGAVSVYLLWGLVAGALASYEVIPPYEYFRLHDNIMKACSILIISGVAVIAFASARYYTEEMVPYVLIIYGVTLHWGLPFLVEPPASPQMEPLAGYIMRQFGLVGTVALLTAIPFIIAGVVSMIRAEKITAAKAAKCAGQGSADKSKDEERFYFHCWQMPFCRDYMKEYCDAHRQKKSCWRLRSGCYCDEDMILRALRGRDGMSVSKGDKRFDIYSKSAKQLTNADKRERCNQCVIYLEHQKQKFQVATPLGFLIPIGLTWAYFDGIRSFIHSGMAFVDKFTDQISLGVKIQRADSHGLAEMLSTSGVVEYIFIICIGLIMATLLMKLMEYLIFEIGL